MPDPIVIDCPDPAATARAGERLAPCLRPGDLVGLTGELGAGKTLFVQAVARGLRVPQSVRVTSPTFTLINEYHGGRLPLYHADLYRLERERELDELGLDDICRRADGAVFVEWCDRFAVLGADFLRVDIRVTGDDSRALHASAGGPRARAVLDDWCATVAVEHQPPG